jgi:hypothetical protein
LGAWLISTKTDRNSAIALLCEKRQLVAKGLIAVRKSVKTQYQRALTFFDGRKAQFPIVQCEKALHSNTLLLFVWKLQ